MPPGAEQMREKVDPTTAPLGAAFTGEHADKVMEAIKGGIQQIMSKFGIHGYLVQMIMPLVEWRDGIPIPGETTTKSDFIIVSGRSSAFCGRMQPEPVIEEMRQKMNDTLPLIWRGAWGMVMTGAGVQAPGPDGEAPAAPEGMTPPPEAPAEPPAPAVPPQTETPAA